jgi:hypothetical protein
VSCSVESPFIHGLVQNAIGRCVFWSTTTLRAPSTYSTITHNTYFLGPVQPPFPNHTWLVFSGTLHLTDHIKFHCKGNKLVSCMVFFDWVDLSTVIPGPHSACFNNLRSWSPIWLRVLWHGQSNVDPWLQVQPTDFRIPIFWCCSMNPSKVQSNWTAKLSKHFNTDSNNHLPKPKFNNNWLPGHYDCSNPSICHQFTHLASSCIFIPTPKRTYISIMACMLHRLRSSQLHAIYQLIRNTYETKMCAVEANVPAVQCPDLKRAMGTRSICVLPTGLISPRSSALTMGTKATDVVNPQVQKSMEDAIKLSRSCTKIGPSHKGNQ